MHLACGLLLVPCSRCIALQLAWRALVPVLSIRSAAGNTQQPENVAGWQGSAPGCCLALQLIQQTQARLSGMLVSHLGDMQHEQSDRLFDASACSHSAERMVLTTGLAAAGSDAALSFLDCGCALCVLPTAAAAAVAEVCKAHLCPGTAVADVAVLHACRQCNLMVPAGMQGACPGVGWTPELMLPGAERSADPNTGRAGLATALSAYQASVQPRHALSPAPHLCPQRLPTWIADDASTTVWQPVHCAVAAHIARQPLQADKGCCLQATWMHPLHASILLGAAPAR